MDQASTLRQIVGQRRDAERQPRTAPRRNMRVIAITSGKGGVGKTNIVLNLALALTQQKRRVFLLDADMGLANVDVLLGLTPRYTLEHVMSGQKDILDIVLTASSGLRVLPAGSGISELSEMSFEQQMLLFRELSRIDAEIDYLFIDTGAGISSNVLRFNASANEVIVVANPEPTAITDAYALMKLLAIKYHIREFKLIANSVNSEEDGRAVYERLNRVCQQFLRVHLGFLGSIPADNHVRKAVRQQRPLLEAYPGSPAGRSLLRIAAAIDGAGRAAESAASSSPSSNDHTSSFWDRLLHWKKAK